MKETLSNGHIVMWGPYTKAEIQEIYDDGIGAPPIRLPSLALKPSVPQKGGVGTKESDSGEEDAKG